MPLSRFTFWIILWYFRKLEPDIERLKAIMAKKVEDKGPDDEQLPETESESDNSTYLSNEKMTEYHSPVCLSRRTADSDNLPGHETENTSGQVTKTHVSDEDDLLLSQYLHSRKNGLNRQKVPQEMQGKNKCQNPSSLEANNRSQKKVNNDLLPKVDTNKQSVRCKRPRIIISSDESSDNSEESHVNLHMEKEKDSKNSSLELPDNMSAYSSERIITKVTFILFYAYESFMFFFVRSSL